jgi:hypothetical protein
MTVGGGRDPVIYSRKAPPMMLTAPLKTIPLRLTLTADAIVCAATAALMLAAAGPLADLLDLPANLLRVGGLLLVPYVAFLVAMLRRNRIPASGVGAAIATNLAWAAGCVGVLLSGQVEPNAVGVAFILVQVVAVLALADLQAIGLRQAGGR